MARRVQCSRAASSCKVVGTKGEALRPDRAACTPTPPACSVLPISFGHQLKGDALVILSPSALPNRAAAHAGSRHGRRWDRLADAQRRSRGQAETHQRRQGSQPLTQGPGARHRPPEGARSPYPPRADPTRSAGAAPAHSIIRSEMAWRRPRPGSLGSPPVRAPRLRSPAPCRATAGREGAS